MKFNIKKIASVLTGAIMLSSTIALAATTTGNVYPKPFVNGGVADVAVIYGSNAAVPATEVAKAQEIATKLGGSQTTQAVTTTPTTATPTGETVQLYTGSSKIYVNDSLNTVKNVLTKSELPTILKDGSFSGNVDATYTQSVVLGANPKVIFAEQPTSDDDPVFGLSLSTSSTTPVYNATVTFNKAVNVTHADSKGEELFMFGQKFTIASATDTTDLVLLKSAEKISLSSTSPKATVTVGGKSYTVELVSASDTSATVKVTDAAGVSDTKEVNENGSKKVQGLTVAVTNADETNFQYSASIIAGAEKVTLTNGSPVSVGENADSVDGTMVSLVGGTTALTKVTIAVAAENSDEDAIVAGGSFVDPVFGSFKIDFANMNIASTNATEREEISIKNSGDDKMQVTFTDHRNKEKTLQWAKSLGGAVRLQHDSDGRNITVIENAPIYRNGMVVVGNEAEGYLLKLSQITNQSTGYSSDKVKFTDVISGDTYEATLSDEGVGTITIGGKPYDVKYFGAATVSEDERYVRLNYPDSSAGGAVAYPTISTSKAAKLAFYEPLTVDLGNFDGAGTDLTTMKLPDGDGYSTDVTIALTGVNGNFTVNSQLIDATGESKAVTSGPFTYNFTYSAANTTKVYLVDPEAGTNIGNASLVLFEERDDDSNYNGLIVTLEDGETSTDGIGVSDVIRTWGNDNTWEDIQMSSDSDKTLEADKYGTLVTVNSDESDQTTATISYPDEQLYAQIYLGEIGSAITTSSSGVPEAGKSLFYKDLEIASVANKNLIVVGGSCINTVAAKLLGSTSAVCGPAFTAKTGIAASQYLVKTFASPYNDSKIATLVAGYEAAETQQAVDFLLTKEVGTAVGDEYKTGVKTSVAAAAA